MSDVIGNCRNVAEHFARHAEAVQWAADNLVKEISMAGDVLTSALASGKKIIAFGNGGSATQASHFAGELLGRYRCNRKPLPAFALVCDTAVVTCISNDFSYASLFERQVLGIATSGDVAIGLTTSGTSENVLRGLQAARRCGAHTIALCGATKPPSDSVEHVLTVSSSFTAHIQEVHLIVLHVWCEMIDSHFSER